VAAAAPATALPKEPSKVDTARIRSGLRGALKELICSHDVADAVESVRELRIPTELQGVEFCHILSQIVEEGNRESRAICFSFAARLFLDAVFSKSELITGLEKLFGKEKIEELSIDMPAAPAIMRDECLPALEALVSAGLLPAPKLEEFGLRIK